MKKVGSVRTQTKPTLYIAQFIWFDPGFNHLLALLLLDQSILGDGHPLLTNIYTHYPIPLITLFSLFG